MNVKRPAFWLSILLLLIPAVLITYRVAHLGYPLFPAAHERAWQLSMNAYIQGEGKEVKAIIGLPYSHRGQMVVEEKFSSGPLAFNLVREGPNQIGIWSGDIGKNGTMVSYGATVLIHLNNPSKGQPPKLMPYSPDVRKEEQALAERLVAKWRGLEPSARLRAIAAISKGTWGDSPPEDQDLQAWSLWQAKQDRSKIFLVLLRAARLPARSVEGLWLTEGVRSVPLTWVEVWTGKEWENLMPLTGRIYQEPATLLHLAAGGIPTVRVSGGQISEIRWSLNRQVVSQWRHHFERIMQSDHLLNRWSLFRLPDEFQRTFRILLLVPIGALIICVLRNLVGFPTFGIFMPVLMALAFRSTGLVYGLVIFAGFVFIGYAARRFMSKFHLLLVPRLSVLLTLVIIFFTALALIGNKLGIRELMAVGLLPFVILTMTIERFFVIVEEAGIRKSFQTAAGSAAVAAITYEILYVEPLQLTFFVYPELLFAVASAQVLLGRYTGYRLSEYFRFRSFRRRP
jgi:hypothetical protein